MKRSGPPEATPAAPAAASGAVARRDPAQADPAPAGQASVRVGVDTGGTFTDLVLVDEQTGERGTAKVPSTPDDPARAVFAAL